MTAPKSIFLNIAFQAQDFNSSKTRFAFELLQLMPGIEGTRIYSSRYIDDQYTPGKDKIFPRQKLFLTYRRYIQCLAITNAKSSIFRINVMETGGLSE